MDTFEDYCQGLKSENPKVRIKAARRLSLSMDNRAVEPLIKALQDSDRYVRHIAIEGLGELQAQQAVPILLDLIHDLDFGAVVIQALAEIGNPAVIKPLLPLLKDKYPYRREATAAIMGKLRVREAFEPLIYLLDDEYGFVRSMALYAIILIGETYDLPIEPYLQQMLRDEAEGVRLMAEMELEKLGITYLTNNGEVS